MALRTNGGEEITTLILKLLNLHGILLQHGQKITNPLGQTPARWQILGAVEHENLTVSQIARRMGITRQATQRVANILRDERLVRFVENPDHIRSPKLELTKKGRKVVKEINTKQAEWANDIAMHLKIKDIKLSTKLMDDFQNALEKTEEKLFE